MMNMISRRLKMILGNIDVGNRIRKRYVLKAMKRLIASRSVVLDAGCGSGDLLIYFAEMYRNSQFDGVEIDEARFHQCKEESRNSGFRNMMIINGDLTRYFVKARYDIIYCVDVLEHIVDDIKVFRNMYESLKEKGTIVLHIPMENQNRYLNIFRKWHQDDHVRSGYNEMDISQKLKSAGLKIVNKKYTFGWAGELAWEIQNASMLVLNKRLAQLITLPFVLLLSEIEMNSENQKGNGILLEIARD